MQASGVRWVIVVLLGSSVAACGEPPTVEPGTDGGTTTGRDGSMTPSDGTVGPSSAGLPCDVEDVVWRRCVTCHAAPPRNGAPMSLVTHNDFLRPAVTDPSRRVIDLVPIRLADARDPMPEDGPLSAEDRATLDAWLAAGGPERSGTDECTTVEPPDPMVDPIDCTVTHSFLAHGAGDAAFHVPATTSRGANLYQCFAFPSTFAASDQAYGWTPVVDDARVLHHMVVFRVPRAYAPGESFECFTMPAGAQIIAAWAPGGDSFELPPTVGLELPESGDSIVLQIHYWNIPGYTDALDRSGIGLCTGPARGTSASYLNAGTASISIPPRTTGHEGIGGCDGTVTSGIGHSVTALAAFPHMHQLGRAITTSVYRGSSPDAAETIVHVEPWNFDNQGLTALATPVVIDPGDAVATRCVWDNPGDTTVTFGERTEDEMCGTALLVYPLTSTINCF